MVKLAALWRKQGEKGPFLVGKIGDATLLVFPNQNKKADNQPDYEVFVDTPRDKPAAPKKNNNGDL